MPAAEFLDTNVLVYAYDTSDPVKQRVAKELVRRAVAGEFVISAQVLGEFAATLLHKVSPPVAADNLIVALDALAAIKLLSPDGDLIRRAVQVRTSYGLHFYDGMIVAAAERLRCPQIWSEDFTAGQTYFGVTVRNPFS